MVEKLNLSPPWTTMYHKIEAMFARDLQVQVGRLNQTEDGNYSVNIKSSNATKLAAIEKIMKPTHVFGNVTLSINFVYPNPENEDEVTADDYRIAFMGNDILNDVVESPYGPDASVIHIYAMFEDKVVQFFNDDISDLHGNYNGLASDIAKELFVTPDNVHYNIMQVDEVDVDLCYDDDCYED